MRTRRLVLTASCLICSAMALSAETAGRGKTKEGAVLKITPRYYRWHVDPGVEWTEANTRYATLSWEVPLKQCALVLVDVWNSHYLKETLERTEKAMVDYVMPTVDAARASGMPIIHCPAPGLAQTHPNWVKLIPPGETIPGPVDPEWPPPGFRGSGGDFRQYARPREPREAELTAKRSKRDFHPLLKPLDGEPVVATGEELHRYCKQNGILFLVYAGFNTNACILLRDYGTIAMGARGYTVIILREAGTGMESYWTTNQLQQTQNTILFLEMFGKYSLSCQELIKALGTPGR